MENVGTGREENQRHGDQGQLLNAHTRSCDVQNPGNARDNAFGAALEEEEDHSIQNHAECDRRDERAETMQFVEWGNEEFEGQSGNE